jgi:hypothetical protein
MAEKDGGMQNEIFLLRQEMASLKKEMIKRQSKAKWAAIDILDEIRYADCPLTCRICGYSDNIKTFKKLTSRCIFEGGKLERYECPRCGLIFGPLKILLLDEASLADEYKTLYEVYAESSTTVYEMKTFLSMNPQKDGVYLNYGCGAWSDSIKILREQGWHIFGYEPYVSPNNPYTINNAAALTGMKFDGIFSHNLIEHLQYPLQFFQFTKSLLKSNTCKMAHSTACYDYAFEFTRFHVHFYTGKSINYLCGASGLIVDAIIRDPSVSYINYVYSIKKP